jgi:hypothetical protein
MPSLHAVSGLQAYMACPHYMQLWSLQGTRHTTITCRSRVYKAHAMPSLSAISELARHMPCPRLLLCIALCYFILLCILSLICPMWPKPCGLQDMYHVLIICSHVDWVGICHALITCSFGACQTYAMTSFIQFLSL